MRDFRSGLDARSSAGIMAPLKVREREGGTEILPSSSERRMRKPPRTINLVSALQARTRSARRDLDPQAHATLGLGLVPGDYPKKCTIS